MPSFKRHLRIAVLFSIFVLVSLQAHVAFGSSDICSRIIAPRPDQEKILEQLTELFVEFCLTMQSGLSPVSAAAAWETALEKLSAELNMTETEIRSAIGARLNLQKVATAQASMTAKRAIFNKQKSLIDNICNRAPVIRNAVTSLLKRPCEEIATADIKTIHSLTLKDASRISAAEFADFISLESLTFEGASFKRFPKDIFSRLSRLTVLKIVDSKISEFQDSIFSDLVNLEHLEITDATLTKQLPANLLRGLKNLQILKLDNLGIGNANLPQLDDNLFNELTSLRELSLKDNEFTNFQETMFLKLTELRKLEIGGNRSGTLPLKLFTSLNKLELLQIENMGLIELQAEHLQHNIKLQSLQMAFNRVRTLPITTFDTLNRLSRETSTFNNNLLDSASTAYLRQLGMKHF